MLGIRQPAHVVSPSITVRGLLNISAVAVYDAQVNCAKEAEERLIPSDRLS